MRFGRTEKRWIHTCEAPIFKIAAAAFPELLQGALGIDILSQIAS
jgi:hypothetical protein